MTERAEADTVAFEIEDRIAWVRFNRPEKRNALSNALRARPLLRALSRSLLTGHRRAPALRRSTRASLLRSTGAGWDVGP